MEELCFDLWIDEFAEIWVSKKRGNRKQGLSIGETCFEQLRDDFYMSPEHAYFVAFEVH